MFVAAYHSLRLLDAKTTTRIVRIVLGCAVALYMLGGYYLIGMHSAARFADGSLTPLALWSAADGFVPLVTLFVFPYLLYIPVLISPGLLPLDFGDFVEGCAGYVVASTIAFAFFLTIPARMEYPALACGGVACTLLQGLYDMDGGLNVFPSLHVSHCLLAAVTAARSPSRGRYAVWAAALAVSSATVLTKQHYVVDLPAGLLTGVVGIAVARHMRAAIAGKRLQHA